MHHSCLLPHSVIADIGNTNRLSLTKLVCVCLAWQDHSDYSFVFDPLAFGGHIERQLLTEVSGRWRMDGRWAEQPGTVYSMPLCTEGALAPSASQEHCYIRFDL